MDVPPLRKVTIFWLQSQWACIIDHQGSTNQQDLTPSNSWASFQTAGLVARLGGSEGPVGSKERATLGTREVCLMWLELKEGRMMMVDGLCLETGR